MKNFIFLTLIIPFWAKDQITGVLSVNLIEASKVNELILKINQIEQNQNNQKILLGRIVNPFIITISPISRAKW